jgi:hypothetical protein
MKSLIRKFPWNYAGLTAVAFFLVMKALTPGNSAKGDSMLLVTHDSHRIKQEPYKSFEVKFTCEKCGADSSTKAGRNKLKEKCKVKK